MIALEARVGEISQFRFSAVLFCDDEIDLIVGQF